MSSFFEDKKIPPKQTVHHHGFFETVGIEFFRFLFGLLSWILKPLAHAVFSYEGLTHEQAKKKALLSAGIFLVILFLGYTKIPWIRDSLTLSTTHTINIHKYDGKVNFPDRSYFTLNGVSTVTTIAGYGDTRFVTYSGLKRVPQGMEEGTCHMLTRGEKLHVSSSAPPVQAEGFENIVMYRIGKPLDELSLIEKAKAYWETPHYIPHLWGQDVGLSGMLFESKVEIPWDALISEWATLPTSKSGDRAIEVKALVSEHGLICF